MVGQTFHKLSVTGIYCTSNSIVPVSTLAAGCPNPARVVSMHFFGPTANNQLAEIVRGEQTSRETLRRAYDSVQQLSKTPIVVADTRGHFVSRVLSTYLNEGLELFCDGMAPAEIEHAAFAAGMLVSPLQLQDEIDISSIHAEYSAHQSLDTRCGLEDGYPVINRPLRQIAQKMSGMGRSGVNTGKGF